MAVERPGTRARMNSFLHRRTLTKSDNLFSASSAEERSLEGPASSSPALNRNAEEAIRINSRSTTAGLVLQGSSELHVAKPLPGQFVTGVGHVWSASSRAAPSSARRHGLRARSGAGTSPPDTPGEARP